MWVLVHILLLHFQSRYVLMAKEKQSKMAQVFDPSLPTWETQMTFLVPGFGLSKGWPLYLSGE